MRPTARLRVAIARHPWIHWTVVGTLAAGAALAVRAEMASVGEQRAAWGTAREVLVADGDLEPGEPLRTRWRTLPAPAVPAAAVTDVPDGALARQHVADGEVVVDVDLIDRSGPAAHAPDGTVVVAVVDPLMRDAAVGDRVRVAADGMIVARHGLIVHVADDVAFVAVDPDEAAAVTAAARDGRASLVYVP